MSGSVKQGDNEWHDLGSKTAELTDVVTVGVATNNASTKPFQPTFKGFRIEPAKVETDSTSPDEAAGEAAGAPNANVPEPGPETRSPAPTTFGFWRRLLRRLSLAPMPLDPVTKHAQRPQST